MAQDDTDNPPEPDVANLEDYQRVGDPQGQVLQGKLARLEDWAIEMLYSFIERDGTQRRFWVKILLVMFIMNAGPAILIALFFFGRDLGYFE
ncbi:MAG: hypothetical protein GY725_11490 [bacterium]|nr:hypothetical protein [bacterium]